MGSLKRRAEVIEKRKASARVRVDPSLAPDAEELRAEDDDGYDSDDARQEAALA